MADPVATDFESFALGSVKGQFGWKSVVPGNIPSLPNGYDQSVVPKSSGVAAFERQSFRLSNAYNPDPGTKPPEYHYQTYSTPTAQAAGEDQDETVYSAQFSFISTHPDAEQSGLRISVSPDMGEGGRMSYIGLNDTPDGINVVFFDTPGENGEFEPYDLGTLPRDKPHTIRFWMKLNPGPDNDLVRIFVDGRDAGQCFTTWENFYRATSQDVPISDRLLFLSGSRDGNHPSLLGGGYLFDNVSPTTGGAALPGCDLPIVKEATSSTVRAGGLADYRITGAQPRPFGGPQPPCLRSHPAPHDVRERQSPAGSPRPRALSGDPEPRARPPRQLPDRAPRRCGRAAGQVGQRRRYHAGRHAGRGHAELAPRRSPPCLRTPASASRPR